MFFDAGRMRAASLGSRDFSSGAGWGRYYNIALQTR